MDTYKNPPLGKTPHMARQSWGVCAQKKKRGRDRETAAGSPNEKNKVLLEGPENLPSAEERNKGQCSKKDKPLTGQTSGSKRAHLDKKWVGDDAHRSREKSRKNDRM